MSADRACPNCALPLRVLRLTGHYEREIEIDLCAPCRVAWFDARESMQLSGLGWIGLLEALDSNEAATRPWRGQALGCPRCRKPLRRQHNRTRWGLFVGSACPDEHGRLQSHAALLAERGLLRVPTAADREVMAHEAETWHCLNCGAAIDSVHDSAQAACRFCATPLLLFDLERLASSLLPRPQERKVLPGGSLDVRPCRTCGVSLDPTRHTVCPQCGQTVLARSLAELRPLLVQLRQRWNDWPSPAMDRGEAAAVAAPATRIRPLWQRVAAWLASHRGS